MEFWEAAFPWFCAGVFLLAVVAVVVRSRDAAAVFDLRLMFFVHPVGHVLTLVVLLLKSAVTLALGLGLMEAGYSTGWGMFILAATLWLAFGFVVWVARQPLQLHRPDDEKDTEPDQK